MKNMSRRHFAISDIHGCFDSLKELIENIIQLQKEDQLIFLGDYIDRGPDSKKVLDYIMELKDNNYDVVTLLGNHEYMLLDAYYNDETMWSLYRGIDTMHSFKVEKAKDIEQKYIDFLLNMNHYYELDEYLLVHAEFNDELDDPFLDTDYMLWTSEKQYFNPLLKDRTIIHGHTPISLDYCQEQISNNNKVIDIDGGCVYPHKQFGKLIALELTTKSIYFVENKR